MYYIFPCRCIFCIYKIKPIFLYSNRHTRIPYWKRTPVHDSVENPWVFYHQPPIGWSGNDSVGGHYFRDTSNVEFKFWILPFNNTQIGIFLGFWSLALFEDVDSCSVCMGRTWDQHHSFSSSCYWLVDYLYVETATLGDLWIFMKGVYVWPEIPLI